MIDSPKEYSPEYILSALHIESYKPSPSQYSKIGMLHNTTSYGIVLYCIVLYCIVLHCIVLYCIILYCIVLYCIVLYCIVFSSPLIFSLLFYFMLCYAILCYAIQFYSPILFYSILSNSILIILIQLNSIQFNSIQHLWVRTIKTLKMPKTILKVAILEFNKSVSHSAPRFKFPFRPDMPTKDIPSLSYQRSRNSLDAG